MAKNNRPKTTRPKVRRASAGINITIPEDVVRSTSEFVQRLLGPVAEAADFLGVKVRFFRWQSAIKTVARPREIAHERGIEPKAVPVKFLVPFLEKSSLEDEQSDLTEEWAKLLVAAADKFNARYSVYVDILSIISSTEAVFLKRLWGKSDGDFYTSSAAAIQMFDVPKIPAVDNRPSLDWINDKKSGRSLLYATNLPPAVLRQRPELTHPANGEFLCQQA